MVSYSTCKMSRGRGNLTYHIYKPCNAFFDGNLSIFNPKLLGTVVTHVGLDKSVHVF